MTGQTLRQPDRFLIDQWHPVASADDPGPARTHLLGLPIALGPGPTVTALSPTPRPLPVRHRYGCLWTTLGTPARDIPAIPEADESDRQQVACGWVTLRTSAPRMVENFLDMAHFPFVHPGILGTEAHPEVPDYRFDIRRDVDEVWATNCRFHNPGWDTSAQGIGSPDDAMDRTYRIPAPFTVVLYRVSRSDPARKDVLAVFVQPVQETLCRAQVVTWLVDSTTPHADLCRFEQTIFLQDRIIVENQRPRLLPLDTGAEVPTRADGSSIAYRRWLKEKGMRWGTTAGTLAGAAA
jgi:phenylpropionate dioxygenase-like ring-hydroxylating dioxygenase large terminal subunit